MSEQQQPTEFKQRWISTDKDAEFPPEKDNRYHLIVNYGCPFACRAATARVLLGLENSIPLHITAPFYGPTAPGAKEGDWAFGHEGYLFDESWDPLPAGKKLVTKEPVFGAYSVREVYEQGHPVSVEECRQKFKDFLDDSTVPVLVDSKKKQVVSAESGDMVKMFWEHRDALGMTQAARDYVVANKINLFPAEGTELEKEVKANTEWIHNGIVFAVYAVGYAENQKAYEEAQVELYKNLDKFEALLDTRRFAAGDHLTFLDLSIAQALVRFDLAYVAAYRLSYKRLRDYKNIYAYTCDIVDLLKMKESAYVKEHIMEIYFGRRLPDRKERFVPVIPADSDFVIEGGHGRDKREY